MVEELNGSGQSESVTKSLELTNFLCFSLYSASRSMTRLYRDYLERHDLTYPQFLVLFLLWQEDERPLRAIRDILHLDGSTVTPLLKRMEAKGLVTRSRPTDDERTVVIRLTDFARGLEAGLVPAVAGGMLCDLKMSPEAIASLAAQIHEVRGVIDTAVDQRRQSTASANSIE